MPRKKIINELKKLIRQRGKLTRQQREYALIEEKGIKEMDSITKPSEEVRFSHLRTLERYIGEHGVRTIALGRGRIGII
jgi:hypothetical protein